MFGPVKKKHFKRAVALGKGAMHQIHTLYHHGKAYASYIDNMMRIGRQGLSILAPHMSGQYGNALMQGAMGAVGAYDSARSHVMSTHDDVLEKIRESGRVLEQLRNIPHEARPMYG